MNQFDEIWPSHADIPIGTDTIPKMCEGARDVLTGKIQGVPAEMHGTTIIVYDIGISRLLYDH